MSLPDTALSALVLVLAILPGLPGDYVYRTFVGVSWREKDLTRVVRLLAFSVFGLLIYSLLGGAFGWVPPSHVLPSTFMAAGFSANEFPTLGLSYFGHFVGSGLAGALAAGGLRALARISPAPAARDTWDELMHSTVQGRWVAVSLVSGDTYLGIVDHVDITAAPEYRDLILREPYQWDASTEMYAPTFHQHLFIRGADLSSIATVFDEKKDCNRLIPIDQTPFQDQQ